MPGPQVEDGYVRIANELLEAIMLRNFNKRELLVLMAIVRKTYGYNKKEDAISTFQIAGIIGIQREHVGRCLQSLINRNVLTSRDSGIFSHGYELRLIGINKHYEQWDGGNDNRCQNSTGAKTERVPKQLRTGAKTARQQVPKQHIQKTTQNTTKRQVVARATRLPHKTLPDEWRLWTKNYNYKINAAREYERFHDYWVAQPGQKGVKLDWLATWRNWIRRDHEQIEIIETPPDQLVDEFGNLRYHPNGHPMLRKKIHEH